MIRSEHYFVRFFQEFLAFDGGAFLKRRFNARHIHLRSGEESAPGEPDGDSDVVPADILIIGVHLRDL